MAYNYAAMKVFPKSAINGLTKNLSNIRFQSDGKLEGNHDLWQRIFKRGEEIGLELGYSEAYGERLDFKVPRKITAEQTKFGKAWLKEHFFKKNGEPRSGKATEYIGERVLQIAKHVTRFEFVGVQVLASQGWYPVQVVPIYRAFNRKGEYFDYAPIHWAQPIIMEG